MLTAAVLLVSGALIAQTAPQPVAISAPDGPAIQADVYGTGPRAVVLLHGGRFDKRSWQPQADVLVQRGFRVVAIDFRASVEGRAGRETSCGYDAVCLAKDVAATLAYLRRTGATSIALVGASLGGGAAAQAAIDAAPGTIDRVVLLAHMTIDHPERLKTPALFIVARDDANASGPRLPGIREQYREGARPEGARGPRWRGARAVPVRLAAGRRGVAGHPPLPRRYLIQVSPKARKDPAGTDRPGAGFPLIVIVALPAGMRR